MVDKKVQINLVKVEDINLNYWDFIKIVLENEISLYYLIVILMN